MARTWLFSNVLLLYIYMCCNTLEAIIMIKEAYKNSEFQDKKIGKIPMKTLEVTSKIDCVFNCIQANSCLSLSFNNDSRVCHLYDQDFLNVTESQTTDEKGWTYYYVLHVPDDTIDKSKCELPTFEIGICRSFCFFYRNINSPGAWSKFIQACTTAGGTVVKVDRYLKQYCAEKVVDSVIGGDVITLGGMQNETTGEWSYFDGTSITYTYWDVEMEQPSYVSPSATPGQYEGILATTRQYKYLWHDYHDNSVNAVLCEIN